MIFLTPHSGRYLLIYAATSYNLLLLSIIRVLLQLAVLLLYKPYSQFSSVQFSSVQFSSVQFSSVVHSGIEECMAKLVGIHVFREANANAKVHTKDNANTSAYANAKVYAKVYASACFDH